MDGWCAPVYYYYYHSTHYHPPTMLPFSHIPLFSRDGLLWHRMMCPQLQSRILFICVLAGAGATNRTGIFPQAATTNHRTDDCGLSNAISPNFCPSSVTANKVTQFLLFSQLVLSASLSSLDTHYYGRKKRIRRVRNINICKHGHGLLTKTHVQNDDALFIRTGDLIREPFIYQFLQPFHHGPPPPTKPPPQLI